MPNCLSLVVFSGSLMFLSGSRKGLVVFVMTLVNHSHSQEHKLVHKRLVGSFKMEKKIKSWGVTFQL